MSTPNPNADVITIDVVNGGTCKQQQALKGCFFELRKDGKFYFHGKDGQEKPTAPAGGVATGKSFSFIMDGLIWTIHDFHLDLSSEKQTACGKWNVIASLEHIKDKQAEGIEEDPTFQAQGGIHPTYETVSYAKA